MKYIFIPLFMLCVSSVMIYSEQKLNDRYHSSGISQASHEKMTEYSGVANKGKLVTQHIPGCLKPYIAYWITDIWKQKKYIDDARIAYESQKLEYEQEQKSLLS